jgi:hypothetical protein
MQLGVHFANRAVEPRPGGLGETLQICQQGPDNGSFAGRHYQLAETLCVPAPVHQLRPPIMIGGTGEKRRCGWSRSTPTPATCSPSAWTRWRRSSIPRPATARPSDVTRPRSARPSLAAATRLATWTASCGAWKSTRNSALTSSRSHPSPCLLNRSALRGLGP